MSDSPKVRHANGHPVADQRKEVEQKGELGISLATDGNGHTLLRFSEAVSIIRFPRLQVAQFIAALAKEAKIEIEIKL